MASSLQIDPNTVYDEGAISIALNIPLATLTRARRTRQLRFSRKGKRVFYLGQWLLDWFNLDAHPEGGPDHAA